MAAGLPSHAHGDVERGRGLLGHTRIETTQLYARIPTAELRQSVEFYEAKTLDVLRRQMRMNSRTTAPCLMHEGRRDSTTKPSHIDETTVVAPTGFEPVFQP